MSDTKELMKVRQAAARVTRRGVDLTARTVFADGGKTKWRRRVVTVTEPWAWDVVEPVFRAMTPGARLTTLRHKAFWSQFRDACVAAGGPVIAPHDARHCYAVWNLKGGMDRQQLRRQLGHSPHSILIFTTYGVWIPEVAAEYAGGAAASSVSGTNPGTTSRNHLRSGVGE